MCMFYISGQTTCHHLPWNTYLRPECHSRVTFTKSQEAKPFFFQKLQILHILWNPKVLTMFNTARHLSLAARWIQYTCSHHNSKNIRCNITLPPTSRSSKLFFYSRSLTKFCTKLLLLPLWILLLLLLLLLLQEVGCGCMDWIGLA